MPPRRSARAASVKPASQAVPTPLEKAAARSKSNPVKKRAASPERVSPPAKRSRTSAQKPENDPPAAPAVNGRKPSSKAAAPKKTVIPAGKKARTKLTPVPEAPMPQLRPYFNPLPTPPAAKRPGLQLFAWGAGNFGQFGMGPDILGELDKPKRNIWVEQQIQEGAFEENGAGLESIVGGGLHTIFIDEKGTVWTCGVNDDAALGRVTHNVPDPNNPGAILDVDELTSVPHPLQTLVDENFRAVQVASGDSICVALSAQGDLRVWGSFRVNEGSLGFSNGAKHQFTPVPMLELRDKPGDTEKVSSIAAGCNHVLVLTTHGNIYAWGAGEQGQLGRKVLERRKIHGTVPEKVTLGTRSRKAVTIGAGSFHSFAIDEQGDVWAWGLNSMGQTGTGHDSEDEDVIQLPTKVECLSRENLVGDKVVQIVGGNHHSLFLTASGKLYACGRSDAGQLGLADDDVALQDRHRPDSVSEPVLVTFPDADDPIVQVSSGPHNNMAVTRGGALYSGARELRVNLVFPMWR